MFWKKKINKSALNNTIIPEKITIEIKLDTNVNELLAMVRLALADYLTGKENDLKKLKIELMRPFIQAQWDNKDADTADRINRALASKGNKIRQAFERYKEELLVLEKQKKDTTLVKAKLEILDKLIEGVE